MTYKEFEKQAKKIGHMGKCEVMLGGKYIKDAMLIRGDSRDSFFYKKWFILQNVINGFDAEEKHGYLYSYIIYEDSDAYSVRFIRPIKSNNRGKNPRGANGRFVKNTMSAWSGGSNTAISIPGATIAPSTSLSSLKTRIEAIEKKLEKIVQILGSKS